MKSVSNMYEINMIFIDLRGTRDSTVGMVALASAGHVLGRTSGINLCGGVPSPLKGSVGNFAMLNRTKIAPPHSVTRLRYSYAIRRSYHFIADAPFVHDIIFINSVLSDFIP